MTTLGERRAAAFGLLQQTLVCETEARSARCIFAGDDAREVSDLLGGRVVAELSRASFSGGDSEMVTYLGANGREATFIRSGDDCEAWVYEVAR